MMFGMFQDRQEAGWRLAERLREIPMRDPLVLAIPRGGIEVGAPIARALGAELDVVLSRKLRAAEQPELAIGAVSEGGDVYLNHHGRAVTDAGDEHIETERRRQMAEIERRKEMFRAVRPKASVAGRTVILTDDGIATGSTMMAALHTVRREGAGEVIVAVPVASTDRLDRVREQSDRVVCLHEPEVFWAVGQFYRDFGEVTDEQVVEILREFGRKPAAAGAASAGPGGGARDAGRRRTG